MDNPNQPPKWALRFFRWFSHPDYREDIEGDLLERFDKRLEDQSEGRARWHFIRDVFALFKPALIRPFFSYKSNNSAMLLNYFTIGIRNLRKNKGYSFINIGGLAIGMTVALLISLWIYDELSFNRYHKNYDRIGKVMFHANLDSEIETNQVVPTGLGTYLKEEYDQLFDRVVLVRSRLEERLLTIDNRNFTENGYFMQQDGPALFSLEMIAGNQNDLKGLHSIFLSESLARKIFNDQDPHGAVIRFNEQVDLTVTGVYKDLPENTTLYQADYLAPLDIFLYGWSNLDVWDNQNMFIYVQLKENQDWSVASARIEDAYAANRSLDFDLDLFIHPMSEWNLNSSFENGQLVTSDRLILLWYYGAIGFLILCIACVNFMNLSTARSENRAREIGVRKCMGSTSGQIIRQFLVESTLVSFLAFIVAIGLAYLILPFFNHLSGKTIAIPFGERTFWLAGVLFVMFTGVLAGSYPAFLLSALNPVKSLKGKSLQGVKNMVLPRKILVVFQFTISIILIIGTGIIYQQVEYVKDRPVGYLREGLLMLPKRSDQLYGKYEVLRNELLKTGVVEEVGEANYPLTNTLGNNSGFSWEGSSPNNGLSFNTIRVNPHYGRAVGWELVAGNDFDIEKTVAASVIITESALEKMGLVDPVGKVLHSKQDYWGGHEFTIVGVVKDMIKGDPFEQSVPAIMFLDTEEMYWQFIRIAKDQPIAYALNKIEGTYQKFAPDAYTDFKIISEEYNNKFESEEKMGQTAATFSIMAVLISCLGLFGLTAYMTEKRAREIGIRKVLGASIFSIWQLLTREFLVLVLIAAVLACPLAYYLIKNWILTFDYHLDISVGIFMVTTGAALLITLITVSYQSIKSARSNPVDVLIDD